MTDPTYAVRWIAEDKSGGCDTFDTADAAMGYARDVSSDPDVAAVAVIECTVIWEA